MTPDLSPLEDLIRRTWPTDAICGFRCFTVDGDYIREVFIGRTEPDPEVLAAHANERAHGRPIPELYTEVATAQGVSPGLC